jgi:hypothetical protein
MKITNISDNILGISDLLSNSVTQYQDGIKTLTIPIGEYRTVPNLQACNSAALKALVDAGGIVTVDDAVEPDGTDGANPTWEIGGPIIGMPQ